MAIWTISKSTFDDQYEHFTFILSNFHTVRLLECTDKPSPYNAHKKIPFHTFELLGSGVPTTELRIGFSSSGFLDNDPNKLDGHYIIGKMKVYVYWRNKYIDW